MDFRRCVHQHTNAYSNTHADTDTNTYSHTDAHAHAHTYADSYANTWLLALGRWRDLHCGSGRDVQRQQLHRIGQSDRLCRCWLESNGWLTVEARWTMPDTNPDSDSDSDSHTNTNTNSDTNPNSDANTYPHANTGRFRV